jgi:uncharacterized membrane protein YsdA (DUF1294 family)
MSDRDIVITRSAELEKMLDRLGAQGAGLGQKSISLQHLFSSEINATLKYICGIRNKAAHEVAFSLFRPHEFLQACDRAKSSLQSLTLPPPKRRARREHTATKGFTATMTKPILATQPTFNPSSPFPTRTPSRQSNPVLAIATNLADACGYLLKFLVKIVVVFILSCCRLVVTMIGLIIIIVLALVYLNAAILLLTILFDPNLFVTADRLTATIQPIAIGYLSASLLTIYYYYQDKQAAQQAAWRIPEKRLHQLELLGGWIGAFIAQHAFRHKTTKPSFQLTFNLIVIFHLATLANLFLFQGKFWWISLVIFVIVLFHMNQRKSPQATALPSPKLKIRHQHRHRSAATTKK